MDSYDYASSIYKLHLVSNNEVNTLRKSLLEVGPGDSGLSILFAWKDGFDFVSLLDKDISNVISKIDIITKYEDCKLEYLIKNDKQVTFILKSSKLGEIHVDVIQTSFQNEITYKPRCKFTHAFSNAVLQHMEENEIVNMCYFIRNNSSINLISSHKVKFTDHISGKDQEFMHRLIPSKLWSSKLFRRFPFWTNQLNTDSLTDLLELNLGHVISKPTLERDQISFLFKVKTNG
tara:strand:- start:12537 stop:13235 length:699 start_codon:yes stop_codon:yes gene_type:complete